MSPTGSTVLRTRLRNGLEVRLKEIHTAPVISSWLWYRVGSRNEVAGHTGISHWVEHMLYKGTPDFPAGEIDKSISRVGGSFNGKTSLDWTTFFETMPADHIELALRIEADRMINSDFAPAQVEAERTVIISEREGGENEPTFRLAEEVQAAAFRVHSYHHMVVGDMIDLKTITREDLFQYYRRFYTPSNAILAIAGDFRAQSMLRLIRKLYGPIPRLPRLESPIRPEPLQTGERRVTVEGPGGTPFLKVAYRAPAASDPDFFPLTVLDSVLTGAANLNIFGGGIPNKTSRLYRALIEGEFAAYVHGGQAATIDPYLYTILITIRPDREPEQALEVLDNEIARVQEQPIEAGELAKAGKQARALFAYGSESITNQAFWLGFSEIFDSYDWFETYLDRIASVTPDDVLAVAQKYLVPSNRVVGTYYPVENGSHE